MNARTGYAYSYCGKCDAGKDPLDVPDEPCGCTYEDHAQTGYVDVVMISALDRAASDGEGESTASEMIFAAADALEGTEYPRYLRAIAELIA